MSKLVLLIDDEEYIVNMLELKLKEHGYKCLTCTTTQEGIRAAREKKPHLIIMDIMMPHIDGLEATSILKNDPETKQIPIVMLSAKSLEEEQEKARQAGADGFIAKPILPQKLLEKIKAFLN